MVGGLVDVAALNLEYGSELGFSLEYVHDDGGLRRVPLAECVAGRFEDVLPVRSFHWARGAAHFPGSWWSSTMGDHVGFESWLERDHVMLMDFDPDVTGIASQPFWLHWQDEEGRPRRHAPDFFARRAGGGGVVIDVRPDDRIPARDAGVFRMTALACAQAGWELRRAGAIDPVLRANVRWLSRYRHRRCLVPEVAGVLLAAFAGGRGLFEGAEMAGDRLRTLPVLFHLMWQRQLRAVLSGRLGRASVVFSGARW